jgi:hypothetical protein
VAALSGIAVVGVAVHDAHAAGASTSGTTSSSSSHGSAPGDDSTSGNDSTLGNDFAPTTTNQQPMTTTGGS